MDILSSAIDDESLSFIIVGEVVTKLNSLQLLNYFSTLLPKGNSYLAGIYFLTHIKNSFVFKHKQLGLHHIRSAI